MAILKFEATWRQFQLLELIFSKAIEHLREMLLACLGQLSRFFFLLVPNFKKQMKGEITKEEEKEKMEKRVRTSVYLASATKSAPD